MKYFIAYKIFYTKKKRNILYTIFKINFWTEMKKKWTAQKKIIQAANIINLCTVNKGNVYNVNKTNSYAVNKTNCALEAK